jgi:heme/copper-type cytochrome/quinol oxidase subunit 4
MGIFMIRGGEFGFEFSTKLLLTLIAILIVVYDWKKNDRKDYLWVFITGTVIWASAELLLQLTGVRVMPVQEFFGIQIPRAVGVIFQGTSEGAYVAVVGLFVADRLVIQKTKNWKEGLTGILAIMVGLPLINFFRNGIQVPDVGNPAIPSRRLMFDPVGTIFIATLVIIGVIWILKTNPEFRRRAISMFLGMVLLAFCFTLFEWIGGTRWIEVGPELGPWLRAPPLVEFGALAYDVMIEIAALYVPFFAIPCMLRAIKPANDL